MNEKFLNLPQEKRDRIINGAITIFGKHSYKKATTDEIITRAGISKGLLFHYFGSKKKLYLDLYEYCLDYIAEKLYIAMDDEETDFFEIIRKSTINKLKIIKQYPAIFNFVMQAYYETAPEVAEEINQQNEKLSQDALTKVFSKVDFSKFKDASNFEKILNTIIWSSKGLVDQKMVLEEFNPEQICIEFDAYLQMYRQAFYKEEYL
ncbi:MULTISPECIES: TetR/AcrR family transcriptional regulator [Bacillus]|uniref:TetR/AcrR family transcriptional regulator n=1 Tax=Bacillus TaxID=1386 RepID=UPI0003049CE6|nr:MULTISPECIES: TetR/AcrR family transcriptional regulator [Bacillus]